MAQQLTNSAIISQKARAAAMAAFSMVVVTASFAKGQNALEMLQTNTNGNYGLYLKRVDGPVAASFRSDEVFEPASAIKVLIHAHIMRRVQQDPATTLADPILWNADATKFTNGVYVPGGADCASDNLVPQTSNLSQSLRMMMESSDNALTQSLRDAFGDINIDVTRTALGMFKSTLDHSIGCGSQIDSNPNRLTLEEVGRLHELVATGFLNESTKSDFYELMVNSFPNNLASIINDEAAKQGKAHLANDFISGVQIARKGGSYDWQSEFYRADAGWGAFPIDFGNDEREFVFGAFVEKATNLDLQNTGSQLSISSVESELLRLAVRGALQTWKIPGLVSPGIKKSIDDLTKLKADNPRAPFIGNIDAALASLDRIVSNSSQPVADFDANILSLSAIVEDLESSRIPRGSFFDITVGGLVENAKETTLDALALAVTLGDQGDATPDLLARAASQIASADELLAAAAVGRGSYADAVEAYQAATRIVTPGIEFAFGDVNYDGAIDAKDIDAITQGVIAGNNSAHYDLQDDGVVDQQDRIVWVEKIMNTYFGDSNLDGEFNSGDLVQTFSAKKYEDGIDGNATWSEGDWNGNGDFESGDLVQAFAANGYEQGPRAIAAVPEPDGRIVIFVGGYVALTRLRVRRLGARKSTSNGRR